MDISYLLWLQSLREGAAPVIKALFTFLGSKGASVAFIVLPCLVYWCLDKRRGLFVMCAYGTSLAFNQLLKNTFCRYRPWIRDARVVPDPVAQEGATGYSFPSTHTQSSASILVGLGWQWRHKRWLLALGVALTLLIGFSRNFLGVHSPLDVGVAFVEGCLFVWLTDRMMRWAEEDERRGPRIALAAVLLSVAYLAYITLKPYPMDYVDGKLLVDPVEMMVDCYKAAGALAGIAVGWYLEHTYVRFETGRLGWQKVLARMLLGVVLVLVCYAPVGHALMGVMGELWGNYARHVLAFVVAMAVAPACFGRLDSLVQGWSRAR